MQSSTAPVKFQVPFASSAGAGYIRAIPVTSGDPLAADFTSGFKVAAFTPLAAGGTPPDGKDFNGIFNLATSWVQRFQAGYFPAYDATFSAQIGGYALGTILQRASGAGFWRSTTENNVTNPDAAGAGWVLHGVAKVFGRTGDVVATAGDYTVDKITGAVADTDFTLSIVGTSWERKSPDGWLEKGGVLPSTTGADAISFTHAFPNACLGVWVNENSAGLSNSNCNAAGWTTAGFTLYAQSGGRSVVWFAKGY